MIIQKDENGNTMEPYEEAVVDVAEEYTGSVVDLLSSRKGQMLDMAVCDNGVRSESSVQYRSVCPAGLSPAIPIALIGCVMV